MNDREQSIVAIKAHKAIGKPSAIWLISFGDLLTLLLCFFLSIVSFGPLNPNAVLPKTDVTARTDKVQAPADTGRTPGGTHFATKTHGRHAGARHFGELTLKIAEDEYTDLGDSLVEVARERLTKAVITDSYAILSASVSSCSTISSERSGWFQSVSRAIGIRRQLVDAGLKPDLVKVRVLGRGCLGLVPDSQGNQAVDSGLRTLVVLKLMRKIHG